MIKIFNEDCLLGMKKLADSSIDLILTDLPYNLTDCDFDKNKINLSELWIQFKRILKPKSAVLLFASSKFTFKLYNSNPDWYKYKWIWLKNKISGFPNAKNRPMCKYEEVLVFSNGVINHPTVSKNRMKYNPQGLIRGGRSYSGRKSGNVYGDHNSSLSHTYTAEYRNYPNDILQFNRPHNVGQNHPTEKPVDLLEYLIKTYTDSANETVLDATMGSGSTGVACVNTGRNFIGYELDEKYFEAASRRIDEAVSQKAQSLFSLEQEQCG